MPLASVGPGGNVNNLSAHVTFDRPEGPACHSRALQRPVAMRQTESPGGAKDRFPRRRARTCPCAGRNRPLRGTCGCAPLGLGGFADSFPGAEAPGYDLPPRPGRKPTVEATGLP